MTRFESKFWFGWNAQKAAYKAFEYYGPIAGYGKVVSVCHVKSRKCYIVTVSEGFGPDAPIVTQGTFRYGL